MRRFSRRKRGSAPNAIDAKRWLSRLCEEGDVPATSLEELSHADVPATYAVVGRGEDGEGTPVVVCFSPSEAGDALLAALATGARLATEESYSGVVLAVAPAWSLAARRRLGLVRAELPFELRTLAVPSLADGDQGVEAENELEPTAVDVHSVASQIVDVAQRELCERAIEGLSGLAAKYGGGLRAVGRSVEAVILAQRVAELRAGDDEVVLQTLGRQRSTSTLTPGTLASALDGLEGQIRRRVNDKRVVGGEGGLRTRVLPLISQATGLRSVSNWPLGGSDREEIDLIGVRENGWPVAGMARQRLDLPTLGTFLDAVQKLRLALPVALSGAVPPVRFELPNLVIAAKEFSPGGIQVLSGLALAYEFFEIRAERGQGFALTSISAEEASRSRTHTPPRRGRRRPERTSAEKPDADEVEKLDRREEDSEKAGEENSASRGGSRRNRRRRGRGRSESETSAAGDTEKRSAPDGGEIEEVSLFDLDEEENADGSGEGRRRGRSRSRGRRRSSGSRSGEGSGNRAEAGSAGESRDDGKAGSRRSGRGRPEAEDSENGDEVELSDDPLDDLAELPSVEETAPQSYEPDDLAEEGDDESGGRYLDREKRRAAREAETSEAAVEQEPPPRPRRRAIIVAAADRDSLLSSVLLARDVRLLEGIWIYPQGELMNFFREVLPDSQEDVPVYLVGFVPSPAVDILQAAALYRDRITWFDHHEWPPEDVFAMEQAIGSEAVHHTPGVGSSLPAVLATGSRRSRFSDKMVDLAGARFTEHDYERWGRLWWWRLAEIAKKTGDVRSDLEPLLAGRPSDLAKEAAKAEVPEIPPEVAYVEKRDFRLIHFGGYGMTVVDVPEELDVQLTARIARERYAAQLSLSRHENSERFFLAGEDSGTRRSLDLAGLVGHLVEKLDWVVGLSEDDHLARFMIRDLEKYPERLDEVIGEVAMGRSILEG